MILSCACKVYRYQQTLSNYKCFIDIPNFSYNIDLLYFFAGFLIWSRMKMGLPCLYMSLLIFSRIHVKFIAIRKCFKAINVLQISWIFLYHRLVIFFYSCFLCIYELHFSCSKTINMKAAALKFSIVISSLLLWSLHWRCVALYLDD